MDHSQPVTPFRSILLPVIMFGVAVAFYLYEFLLRVAPGPMFADLMRDFNIEAMRLGVLASMFFLPYAFLQLPVGAWTDKYGPRRLLTLAIFLCAVSTLIFAQTESFLMVCVARLFMGVGGAFAFISCMKIITVWFKPKWFPILTGLTLTFGSLGGVAGISSLSYALELVDWRTLFYILGVVGLILCILSWAFIRDGHAEVMGPILGQDKKPVAFWSSLKAVMHRPQNWLVALYAFMVTAPTDTLGGQWGVAYLVQAHGFEKTDAATAAALSFVGMALGSPAMGWASNYWNSRRRPMMIGALCATLCLVYLVFSPSINFWQAAVSFFAFGFFGGYVMAFVVIRDINPSEFVGTAVGFVNGVSMIGSTLLIYGVGALLSVWSTTLIVEGVATYSRADYQQVLILLPICYALAAVAVIPFVKESYSLEKYRT